MDIYHSTVNRGSRYARHAGLRDRSLSAGGLRKRLVTLWGYLAVLGVAGFVILIVLRMVR